MSNKIDVLLATVVLTLSAGCTQETGSEISDDSPKQQQADLAFGLMADVLVAPGHRVKFMQPSEGAIAIVETFSLGHKKEVDVTQPIHALWQDIAPDRQMPAALVTLADAEQLALENKAASRAQEPVDGADSAEASELLAGEYLPEGDPESALVEKHQTSDPVHFEVDQKGCNNLRKNLKWSWCWENRTGGWFEAAKSGEAIASAISVYQGTALDFCNRMGNDVYCQDVRAGQGTTFIGKVGTNWLGVHVDQVLQSRIPIIVIGTNWHWGGSISGDWDTIHTFGGYRMDL